MNIKVSLIFTNMFTFVGKQKLINGNLEVINYYCQLYLLKFYDTGNIL